MTSTVTIPSALPTKHSFYFDFADEIPCIWNCLDRASPDCHIPLFRTSPLLVAISWFFSTPFRKKRGDAPVPNHHLSLSNQPTLVGVIVSACFVTGSIVGNIAMTAPTSDVMRNLVGVAMPAGPWIPGSRSWPRCLGCCVCSGADLG